MRQPFWLLVFLLVLVNCAQPVFSQSLSGQDREHAIIMLRAVRDDIRKYYYDPAFPVLARAVAVAGGTLDPAEAGKLFPFKWKP